MNRSKFIAICLSACVANSLYAVEKDNNETKLDGVVVSASGFSQQIKEAPASISVISGDELTKDSFTSLHSIAQKVPGVNVVGGEDGAASGISIRGMEKSQTLVLIDGKRVNSSSANPKGGAGDVNSNFIPPAEAIERIEVIRGPMSSLYGSDAVGGVINIITKKDFSKFSGNVGISTTINTHKGIGDGRQGDFYLNLPLYKEFLALQLWGYKKLRDEDSYVGGYQKSDKRNLSAKLWITPDEHNKFFILGSNERHDYSRTVGKTANPNPRMNVLNAYDYEKKSYGVGYLGEFDSLNADLSYIYDQTQRSSLFDKFIPAKVKNHNFNSKFTTFFGAHALTFGYDFHKQNVNTTFIVSNASKNGLESPKSYSMSEHAGFIEDEWQILDEKLFLTLGSRLTHNEFFGNHLSPRAYLVYNATDTLSLKGGVATGYKTPDVNQISPEVGTIQKSWSIVDFGNKDLKPEKSTTYEVGAYYDNQADFRGSVTLFRNEFKDKILDTDGSKRVNGIPAFGTCTNAPDVTCPGWGTYFNIEGATVWGVELSGDYDILSNLNLSSNYTYNKSKIKTGNPTINTPRGPMKFSQTGLNRLDGKSLTATPEHTFHATLTYKPVKSVKTFFGANYESKLTSVNFGAGNSVRENTKDLLTFDTGVSWDANKHLTLSLNAYNIFDKVRYDEALVGNTYYFYPQEGRRFWFKVAAKW
ncbi:TonB-dependent receptor domain-containing protein [Campylobacter concisus]|uniref:TonB-dependent receptor domain-containing protein n=1 Tax=Campylobacter concisus TaxID=199 RepID=UPI000CD9BDC8|nr:TonB-dependent receptor [Campylobacter concisus]